MKTEGMMEIGERKDKVDIVVKGIVTESKVFTLINEIIKSVGMHKSYDRVYWPYPFGKAGGVGFTAVQPITESWIAFDSYPAMDGGYLEISSCKTVNLNKVTKKIRALGFKIKQIEAHELRLK